MTSVVLFTGKGGVGKTTVAAATAVRCAELGQRTLVLSTDAAHSLADSLDVGLGATPTEVRPGLWGQELDAQERLEESWGDIKHWLVDLLDWAGVDAVEAEELAVLPGLEELFALTDIHDAVAAGEWETVVVDCAPTAETLRLLSLPDVLAVWMDRAFPVSRGLTRALAPVLRTVSSVPVAGEEVFTATERFYARLAGVKELLSDADTTRVRLVVNPERMVVAEARRTATYLALFGYGVDAVIANRLFPPDLDDPWFDGWKAVQARHLHTIEEGFAPLPVLRAELAPREVIGGDDLSTFGAALYGELDPAARRHEGRPLRVERVADGYELTMELPFTDRDDLELGRRGDELLLRVGPYRRALLLPDSLRRRSVAAASLREGSLCVHFLDP
jgi:arsenite-transporting ATPase